MGAIRGESSSNAFNWHLTASQCTIDPKPTANIVNSNEAIHRDVHHRSAVRQTPLGVLFHRHGHRADIHLHLRITTPMPDNEKEWPTNTSDRNEVDAVEAVVPEGVTVIVNGPQQALWIVTGLNAAQ